MADEKTELETIADLVAAKLQEQANLAAKPNTQAVIQPTSQPIDYNLNISGQKIDFKDKTELESAITQALQKAATENEVLRNQLSKLDSKNSAYVSGDEKKDEFNQDHYVELMGKGKNGILEATDYAINHLLFEGKEKNASSVLKQVVQESFNNKATLAVYQFRERHPEFPLNADTTKVIDGIRAELRQPFTLEGLEASYGVAQSRGLMPNPQYLALQKQLSDAGIKLPDNSQVNTQQNQQVNLGFQPPPQLSRTNTVDKSMNLINQAENLPMDQLEKLLRDAGALQ